MIRCVHMSALKAQVKNGRLVMDEPTELPEGTVLELAAYDPGDDLDDAERAELHSALEKSFAEARAGRLIPVEKVLAKLRQGK